jgi:hypothetical protein
MDLEELGEQIPATNSIELRIAKAAMRRAE